MKKQRKIVLFIAQSLDGYIATKNDSLDWLDKVEGEGDNGFSEFYESIDTVLIGKKTYDWVMKEMKGEFPYPDKESYVFSRKPQEDTSDVTFINGDIVNFANNLKKQEGKNIWIVGGGDILYPFLNEKLVDELIVIVSPTLLGKGIPLFKEGDYQLDLSLLGTRTFNQFVELHYEVKK